MFVFSFYQSDIRQEIADIESGHIQAKDSPLKLAPHTLSDIVDSEWDRVYSRETGAFPAVSRYLIMQYDLTRITHNASFSSGYGS